VPLSQVAVETTTGALARVGGALIHDIADLAHR
jgi:hypothetical protein